MIKVWVGICLVLFLYSTVSQVRYLMLKKQIQKFTTEIQQWLIPDYRKNIRVDLFDKDILAMVNVLNCQLDETKKLSIQYRQDRQKLQQVMTGIFHDFRTPLTSITGYLQMIEKNQNLEKKDAEYLSIALEKTSYLKELSDDLFELVSLETDKNNEIKKEKVNLNNVLSEIILQQYQWIQERNLQTDFNIPDIDIMLYTNKHYLFRILENLFSNSRKYAKSYISVIVIKDYKNIIIEIKNDYMEYFKINTEQIFDAFYQGDFSSDSCSSKNITRGNGLGLYIVKCMTEKLEIDAQVICNNGEFSMQLII